MYYLTESSHQTYEVTAAVLCCVYMLSRVRLFVTPWTVAHQAALSMGISKQNTGVCYHALFPNPGIGPRSPTLQADSLPSEPPVKAKVKLLSRVRLFATPWTVAYQVPPSMGFSILEWVAISFSRRSSLPRD